MTEIATSKTFQERMFERIKEQMGDLLTEEDLKKMVDAAMHKAFFENVVIRNHYGQDTVKPPAFVQMIEAQTKGLVEKAVKNWIDDHPELIAKAITEALEKGMFNMAVSYFEQKTTFPLQDLATKLMQKGVL